MICIASIWFPENSYSQRTFSIDKYLNCAHFRLNDANLRLQFKFKDEEQFNTSRNTVCCETAVHLSSQGGPSNNQLAVKWKALSGISSVGCGVEAMPGVRVEGVCLACVCPSHALSAATVSADAASAHANVEFT